MVSARVLVFPGTFAGFEHAFGELRRELDRHSLHSQTRYSCELVFDEIVTNIIKHAYGDDREHSIEVSVDFPDTSIVMHFEDDGIPFDPRDAPAVESPTSLLDAPIGARGLLLVRKVARSIDYMRTPRHRNRLTVTIGV